MFSQTGIPAWSQDEILVMVNDAYKTFIATTPKDWSPLYVPAVPVPVPECFPQTVCEEVRSPSVMKLMDVNTLLFAFAYAGSEEEKVKVKTALNEKGWVWNPSSKSWSSPKTGSFDYTTWKLKSR